jgi:hypothetical protein
MYYTGVGETTPEAVSSHQIPKLDKDAKDGNERAGSDSSSDIKRSNSMKHLNGRPSLPSLVHEEATSSTLAGQLGVFVCGPASMQIDISNAMAAEQLAVLKGGRNDVYLHMEHFSWA